MDNHYSEEIVRQPTSKNLRAGKVTLHPGQEVGEHIPHQREELVVVISGEADVIVEGTRTKLLQGDTIFIAENKKHNIINTGSSDLVYVYVVSIFSSNL